jgi:hypothetical protein
MKLSSKVNAFLLTKIKPKFGFTKKLNKKNSPLVVDFGVMNSSPSETKIVFNGCTYHGVDIDCSMEAHCDLFVKADLEDGLPLQIKRWKYDILILNHVLEHVSNWRSVLADIYKVAKKDSILYIEFPNKNSLKASLLGRYGYHFHNDLTHKSVISVREACQVLLDNGWSVIDYGSKYRIRKGLVSLIKLIPYLLSGKATTGLFAHPTGKVTSIIAVRRGA